MKVGKNARTKETDFFGNGEINRGTEEKDQRIIISNKK